MGLPTLLGLPAKIFPFFSSTSLAWVWWLTMMTRWEPIIREYVCPYLSCSSLKSTWGGLGLHRLSRLPIRGSAGSRGGSLRPPAGLLKFSCSTNKIRPMIRNTLRHRTQSISPCSRGSWWRGQWRLSITDRGWAGGPRAAAGPRFYRAPSMSSPWLDCAVSGLIKRTHNTVTCYVTEFT